ncbi:ATP-binding protein [Acinetobacter sp. TY2]|uniref:ATP-binding protein n=1 Tax=Acinetobacter sp. TY2 TaxID=3387403 RepID=UPI00391770C3
MDTNTLIGKQHLAHLLDRFYQVDGIRHKKAQTGGLGLSIVQSIVKLHGGWVEVENKRRV